MLFAVRHQLIGNKECFTIHEQKLFVTSTVIKYKIVTKYNKMGLYLV